MNCRDQRNLSSTKMKIAFNFNQKVWPLSMSNAQMKIVWPLERKDYDAFAFILIFFLAFNSISSRSSFRKTTILCQRRVIIAENWTADLMTSLRFRFDKSKAITNAIQLANDSNGSSFILKIKIFSKVPIHFHYVFLRLNKKSAYLFLFRPLTHTDLLPQFI